LRGGKHATALVALARREVTRSPLPPSIIIAIIIILVIIIIFHFIFISMSYAFASSSSV
jgi:uncharacterized membrane protein